MLFLGTSLQFIAHADRYAPVQSASAETAVPSSLPPPADQLPYFQTERKLNSREGAPTASGHDAANATAAFVPDLETESGPPNTAECTQGVTCQSGCRNYRPRNAARTNQISGPGTKRGVRSNFYAKLE